MENQSAIKEKLLAATIGGDRGSSDRLGEEALEIFTLYVQRALGDAIDIKNVELLRSKVSLNSIMANAVLMINGKEKKVFLKIHIEANSESQSVIGDGNEYRNAELLAGAGWPVLRPLGKNTDPEFPLLIYPRINTDTLFMLIEGAYTGQSKISERDMAIMAEAQEIIGQATRDSVKEVSVTEAVAAPVQTLFYERFKEGGRIDQWYTDEVLLFLPGILKPLQWKDLKSARWNINGKQYSKSIEEIIASARKSLAFAGENKAFLATSHGDDHSGNIFLNRDKGKIILFDPAFAGENPVALGDTKALAHIGYMMAGGMYFNPQLKTCKYRFDSAKNTIFAEIDFTSTPFFREHEQLATQIIDQRIVPLFEKAKKLGAVISAETQRLRDSLSGCPLLTINIPKLLDAKDGRGVGLLPLTVMLNELQGFESLNYLQEKLSEIEK